MEHDRSGPDTVAYYSMEVALDDAVPTYSGGLGVLAGDHLRAAADVGLPLVGVTLLYHHGYFDQRVDADGHQHEAPVTWDPADHLERLPVHVAVPVGGRRVRVGAWQAVVTGVRGHQVPVYFLDTKVPGNEAEDQAITDALYGGDEAMRLAQELVLGIGGAALLDALGHRVAIHHMNEGHSALLALALLDKIDDGSTDDPWASVRERCVFTTHTPVAAGHDRFPRPLVDALVEPRWVAALEDRGLLDDGRLDMTELALSAARRANAVSRRHGAVTRAMFPAAAVDAVTNGVHVATWVVPPVAELLDRHVPDWRIHNATLRYATDIPLDELRAAHRSAKTAMVARVAERTGVALDPDALTLGVARRATAYKRTALVLSRPDRLRALVAERGPVQFVFAGKAHPRDHPGKDLIRTVVTTARELRDAVTVVFVEGYGMDLARTLCGGVDVWCNTPVRPHEASGTSGMKAAVNGVPSLSVLDGWWIEGHLEGITGWAIGAGPEVAGSESGDPASDPTYAQDADAFVDTLAGIVVPLYYDDPDGFTAVQRGAMALNGSFFTTERMVQEYATSRYGLQPLPWAATAEVTEEGLGA
jgi:starch phosphorylase